MRPSELLAIDNPLHAYWFDRAVVTFGMAIESDLDDAVDGVKTKGEAIQQRQRVLSIWLDDMPKSEKYADPMRSKQQVKV